MFGHSLRHWDERPFGHKRTASRFASSVSDPGGEAELSEAVNQPLIWIKST